jgi:MoaA/NifB/PqqE/SkfB family radical SAM enzyme
LMMKRVARAIERQLLRLIPLGKPLSIQLDITNACNLNCTHCYHTNHENSGAIGVGEWIEVINQYELLLHQLRARSADFIICGGEPLVSPNLAGVLQRVRESSWKSTTTIITNATVITSELLNKLPSGLDIVFQVSLDGANPQRHDLVRGDGSFVKTVAGIDLLISRGFEVSLAVTLTTRNWQYVPDFFDIARDLNCTSINFTRFIEVGMGKRSSESGHDQSLSPKQLEQAYREIVLASARTGVRTNTRKPLFRLLSKSLGASGRFAEGIVVDYQGFVVASSRSRIKLGHALNDGLARVFLGNELLRSIRRRRVKVCGQCRYFRDCGGDRNAAFAAFGDYLGPDPGCWLPGNDSGVLELTAKMKRAK